MHLHAHSHISFTATGELQTTAFALWALVLGCWALPGWSGAMQVTARGITLSSTSVPATICSIPICMRREAHYVAALMWEEGAGERRGVGGGAGVEMREMGHWRQGGR